MSRKWQKHLPKPSFIRFIFLSSGLAEKVDDFKQKALNDHTSLFLGMPKCSFLIEIFLVA